MDKVELYKQVFTSFRTLCAEGKQLSTFEAYCKAHGVMQNKMAKLLKGEYRSRTKVLYHIIHLPARESWDKPHYYIEAAKLIGGYSNRVLGDLLGKYWSHVIHPIAPTAPPLNSLVCSKNQWSSIHRS